MKKTLFTAIFLASLVLPIAQTKAFTADEETTIRTITQQINDLTIQLLLAQIADLKAQIQTMIAQSNASTTQAIAALSAGMDSLTSQSPVMGSASAPIQPTVILGTPICHPDALDPYADIPLTITGPWGYGVGKASYQTIKSGISFDSTPGIPLKIPVHLNAGATTIEVQLGTEKPVQPNYTLHPTYTFTDTIVVGNPCQ